MQIRSSLKSQLVFQTQKSFNALWGPYHERPIVDRVVSTSTWPVPYYQRIAKAYPIRDKQRFNLGTGPTEINDSNWFEMKEVLKKTVKGRELVDWAENEFKTKSFLTLKTDVADMAKCYVNDLCHFLDVAHKENRRILEKYDTLI